MRGPPYLDILRTTIDILRILPQPGAITQMYLVRSGAIEGFTRLVAALGENPVQLPISTSTFIATPGECMSHNLSTVMS